MDEIIEFQGGPFNTLLQVGNPGDGSGAMANAWDLFSSRSFKRDIRSLLPPEYTEILNEITTTDVVRFFYTHDRRNRPHLGVIAEDSPREILTPDGRGVSLGDYNAFLLAGLKAQHVDVETKASQIAEALRELRAEKDRQIEEKDCAIGELNSEIYNLKSQISELKEAVKEMREKNGGGR